MNTFIKQEIPDHIITYHPSLSTQQPKLNIEDTIEPNPINPFIKEEISYDDDDNFELATIKQEELTIKNENQDSLYVSLDQIQQNLTSTTEQNDDASSEELFSCFRCDYQTNKKRYLVDHRIVHAPITPTFTCTFCNYICKKKSNLTRHLRTHTGEKPYNCSVCNHNYADRTSFAVHLKTHNGEKPFNCTICEYSCLRKGDIVRHFRTHTGEKPYQCHLCNYKCTAKGRLNRHVKAHGTKRLFNCELCNYICSRKGHLSNHISKNHIKSGLNEESSRCKQSIEVEVEVFEFNSEVEDIKTEVLIKEESLWEV